MTLLDEIEILHGSVVEAEFYGRTAEALRLRAEIERLEATYQGRVGTVPTMPVYSVAAPTERTPLTAYTYAELQAEINRRLQRACREN